MKNFFAPVILLLVFSAARINAQTYKSPRLEAAKFNHRTMAILPYFVSETDKTTRTKRQTGEKDGVTSTYETEGYNLQRAQYNYFITRKPKNINWTVTFQPYEETNQKLMGAGILWEDIPNTPKEKLGEILGVDAFIYAEVTKTTVLDHNDKVVVKVFTGYNVPTGNVEVETSIYESSTGELMWQLENRVPTDYYYNIGAERLTDNLMKKSVSQFPYKEKAKKK